MCIKIENNSASDLYLIAQKANIKEKKRDVFKSLSQTERKLFLMAMDVLRGKTSAFDVKKEVFASLKGKLGKIEEKHCYSFILSILKAIANLFGRLSSKQVYLSFSKVHIPQPMQIIDPIILPSPSQQMIEPSVAVPLEATNMPTQIIHSPVAVPLEATNIPAQIINPPVEKNLENPLEALLQKLKEPFRNLDISPGRPARSMPKPYLENTEYENAIIPISTRPEGISHSVELGVGKYYSYYCEGFDDGGWGCAWRAIQTLLSYVLTDVPRLDQLFNIFGKKENLALIYKDLYKLQETDDNFKGWNSAPYILNNGWADQFIGQMVAHAYGLKATLGVINGDPNHCPVPEANKNDKLHHIQFNSFQELKKHLFEHFNNKNALPIIIDNGSYTMNILGLGEDKDARVSLWVADPHKKPRNGIQDPTWSSYVILLDKEGKRLSPVKDEELNILSASGGYSSLQFSNNDRWGFMFGMK